MAKKKVTAPKKKISKVARSKPKPASKGTKAKPKTVKASKRAVVKAALKKPVGGKMAAARKKLSALGNRAASVVRSSKTARKAVREVGKRAVAARKAVRAAGRRAADAGHAMGETANTVVETLTMAVATTAGVVVGAMQSAMPPETPAKNANGDQPIPENPPADEPAA